PLTAPPAPRPAPRLGLREKAKRALVVLLLAAMTATSVFSGAGTARFAREQAAAEQTSFRIFYGRDLYVFGDHYIDDRIPLYVLPALRHWDRPGPGERADLERALEVLRESPDPKADNLLLTAFRHASLLPMTDKGVTTLLRALIERDDETLWKSMDAEIAASGDDPAAAELLVKMVGIGVQVGTDAAFDNLFRVLKSPNRKVESAAFAALYGELTAPAKADSFLARLTAVQKKFAKDPALQMWTLYFSLYRTGQPGPALKAEDTDQLDDSVVAALEALDQANAPLVLQALAAARQSGQKPQIAPPLLGGAVRLAAGLVQAAQGDGSSPVPPALARAARHVVAAAANALIDEGQTLFPDLHERLLDEGVLPPDAADSSEMGDSSASPAYRAEYEQWHLQALQKALAALSPQTPAQLEFLIRASAQLAGLQSADAVAGAPVGGTIDEKAAAQIARVVVEGYRSLGGADYDYAKANLLRDRLIAIGVAKPSKDGYGAPSPADSVDAAHLAALHDLLVGLMRDGAIRDEKGKEHRFVLAEKVWLAGALRSVDKTWREDFPATAPKASAAGPQAALAALSRDGDAMALALLEEQIESAPRDAAFLLAAEQAFLVRQERPGQGGLNQDEAIVVLPKLMAALAASPEADQGWAEAARAAASGRLPAKTAEQLRAALMAAAKADVEAYQAAFPDPATQAALAARSILTQEDLGAPKARADYSRRQLEALKSLLAASAAAKTASPEQKAAAAALEKSVGALLAAAPALGAPAGSAAADATERLDDALQRLYLSMPGSDFTDDIRAQGLARSDGDYSSGYWLTSYTPDQLARLRAHLQAILKADLLQTKSDTHALIPRERRDLQTAIAAADALSALRAAPQPGTKLHSFAPLALLAAMPAAGAWGLAAAAAALATWLVWKYAFREPALAPEARDEAAPGDRLDRIGLASSRLANSAFWGSFRSRARDVGGLEYAESRDYERGDEARDIDWTEYANSGELRTKMYDQEREKPLILAVDVSESGRVGTRGADKRTIIEDAAAALALAASRSNIRVGAVLFDGGIVAAIPPRGGSEAASAVVDEILKRRPSSAAGSTDLRGALAEVASMLGPRRGTVIVLSDFLAENFAEELMSLSERHDVRPVRVTDPADLAALPDVGLLPVADAETGATRVLDTSAARASSAGAVARREAKLDDVLSETGHEPVVLSTEGGALETLTEHFNRASARRKP
ncbi:MAG: DUF58 domain-containing protein, partial [Elusimicrobia bacterium]|nr:DUF58 domain-containing protein [Elusimicrobiota bacterium]